jgi:DNA-directed RNA polymerase subunit beta
MPVPAVRTIIPQKERNFGRFDTAAAVPNLTEIQVESYARFLQLDKLPTERDHTIGLEGVLREIFPIESYDKSLKLEFVKYELGKPRFGPDECRQMRLTYGRPFKVTLRLNKEQPVEEEVYLGDMPIMIGGGEFIINGAERVVVSQLHRSPGVDFVIEKEGDRQLPNCRIIPERGSWIEINVTKKNTLGVRIDQSGKFSAMTLLRAMDRAYSTNADILKAFYVTETLDLTSNSLEARDTLLGSRAADDVIDPETGEIYLESCQEFTNEKLDVILSSGVQQVCYLPKNVEENKDEIILASLEEDHTIRLSWKRHRNCSRRSSRMPIGIVWDAWAVSASTGSSTRTFPSRK